MTARRLGLAAAAIVAALGCAAGSGAEPAHEHAAAGAARAVPETFRDGMDASMAAMMKDMHTGYSGNPDIDFLAMMIPHHEGAIEMARLVLIHGRDPGTRRLAEDIIASQRVEIEGMRRRMDQLRKGEAETFPALGGTRGALPQR